MVLSWSGHWKLAIKVSAEPHSPPLPSVGGGGPSLVSLGLELHLSNLPPSSRGFFLGECLCPLFFLERH